MKKWVPLILFILALGVLYYSDAKKQQQGRTQEAENMGKTNVQATQKAQSVEKNKINERDTQELKNHQKITETKADRKAELKIKMLANKYGASKNGFKKAREGKDLFSEISSKGLRKLWVINKPVVFIGTISNLTKTDDGDNQVEIEEPPFNDLFSAAGIKLGLRLKCRNKIIQPIVDKFEKEISLYFAEVAVIATIDNIDADIIDNYNNSRNMPNEIFKYGEGLCLDLILTGRISVF
jgi:hypothetical protein